MTKPFVVCNSSCVFTPVLYLRFRLCEAVVGDGAKRLLVIDVLNPRADRGGRARLDPPPVVGLAVGGRLPHVLKAPEVGPIGRALQPPHEAHEDVHALERWLCVCVCVTGEAKGETMAPGGGNNTFA